MTKARPRSCKGGRTMRRTTSDPQILVGTRRSGMGRAALAVLVLAGALFAGFSDAAPAKPWKKLSEREAKYLEMELAQIRRMKGNMDWIGRQPLAAGALAAAALAAEGRPDASN